MAGTDLDRLADRIDHLRVEYERFFNGALATPPVDLQEHVRAMLRRLRNRPATALADNFRLTQLEARFNSFAELFNRRLREREEGRTAAGRPVVPEASRLDPREGIVVGDGIDPDAAEALYAGLCRGGASPRFDLETFRTYLERQTGDIRARTGCVEVRFRLVDEEGRTKLKARPVRADGADGEDADSKEGSPGAS